MRNDYKCGCYYPSKDIKQLNKEFRVEYMYWKYHEKNFYTKNICFECWLKEKLGDLNEKSKKRFT